MTTTEPTTEAVDQDQLTRAQKALLALSNDVAAQLAEDHGVCTRPLAMRRIDTTTGRVDVVPVPCGSTREDRCRPCSGKARRRRMVQRWWRRGLVRRLGTSNGGADRSSRRDDSMTDLCEVVMTAPDPVWLSNFTRRLVSDGLASSVHNFTPVQSTYRWRGEIHDRTEGRASLHTQRALVAIIVDRAKTEHPYEVPGISARPIYDGNPDYLAWIESETSYAP